ncbi:riboflavin synthase [Methylacidiphilum caldifontis]|uniref:Riboflavin synthase n=1 Tax=Methylacidiphilum caldifontis TaxID=2795386 RepID=A0A4Y8PCM2_9BACT|nr:riboflavin synthase [Methylacidiphilum caldifontis]QSR87970.1 riboflavin synthase [Methylacidiphilum caldifontis]TFE68730.1 riboflavin synthase subunit alpha [Methylacidiphilum caldifontis]
MFTGIIESVGWVETLPEGSDKVLTLDVGGLAPELKKGMSLAVNGCCLTVFEIEGRKARFYVLEETLRATTLGELKRGEEVNLELPLRYNDRIGGHFVTGHVDCKETIYTIKDWGEEKEFWINYPFFAQHLIVPKGSIAVDGISLTVGSVTAGNFCVYITPFTFTHTNLKKKKPGDRVNLEFDLLAKYAAGILQGWGKTK